MDAGFCAIPVTKFQAFMQSDYQLNLLENYLMKLKYSKNMEAKNQKDFGFLARGIVFIVLGACFLTVNLVMAKRKKNKDFGKMIKHYKNTKNSNKY